LGQHIWEDMNMLNTDVICFGGEDWWYHNQGHADMQLMRRFSRLGTTLYINSIVMQKPSLKKNIGGGRSFNQKLLRKAKSIFRGLRKSDAGFLVYSPFTLPVHHLAWARPINEILLRRQVHHISRKLRLDNPLVWVACPVASDVAIKLSKGLLVYQRTDRYEEYPNVDSEVIKTYDRKLKALADLTVFANQMLFNEEASQCKKAFYIDHGVDFEAFSTAEENPYKPGDIAEVPKPTIGYFGSITGHTIDIDFVNALAELLPDMSFVFVGDVSTEINELQARKNVWLLGQKPYSQIPHYGKCFDVAIMPWRQNRWIEGCNPIKLKEYLALGKPVVSTPFPELEQYLDVVCRAKTPEEFAQCIRHALAKNSKEQIAARRKKVETSSWGSKVQILMEELFGDKSTAGSS
jgi:glycosyltransferase involved in cell wall biosynthesis